MKSLDQISDELRGSRSSLNFKPTTLSATQEEEEEWQRLEALAGQEGKNKYSREIAPGVFVDVYDVLQAWGVTNPALQHLIKKALQPGQRGHKTIDEDMAEIVASALRAQELVSARA